TELQPLEWLKRVRDTRSGETVRNEIDSDAQLSEYLMMSLRTNEGAQLTRLPNDFETIYSNKINYLVEIELLEKTEVALRVPSHKRILLNAILKELLT
ncbi:MAG: coproporphyrinogen III oxidase, partial [Litoreibacter sp.]|nr:coproporphyrinogen III oxidase [Litoreibacter sp.]